MQLTRLDTEHLLNQLEGETREEQLDRLQIVCDVLEILEGRKLAVRNIHTKMPIEAPEDCFKLLGVKEECWAEEEEITVKYAKAFSDWGLMAEIAREKRGG